MEIWKDIRGYEGFYQISNHGRVRNIGRYRNVYVKGHNRVSKYFENNEIMTPTDNGNGYLIVSFKILGKRKNHYVHRLVAEHFVENPYNKDIVNHIDCNKKNNVATNLEWVTQKENVLHSVERMKKPKKIYKKSNTGEKYVSFIKGRYRVNIRQFKVCKCFCTLDEAVIFRNEVAHEIGIAI